MSLKENLDAELKTVRDKLSAPGAVVKGKDVLWMVGAIERGNGIMEKLQAKMNSAATVMEQMGEILNSASTVLVSVNTPEARAVLRQIMEFAMNNLEALDSEPEIEDPESDTIH